MKIIDARVVVSSPGRNYVTLVIETESDVAGVGDAMLNGRELAVVSYFRSIPLDVFFFAVHSRYRRRHRATRRNRP